MASCSSSRSIIPLLTVVGLMIICAEGTCHKADRAALLALKLAVASDPSGIFSSWKGTDCCYGWRGVTCHPTTSRVTRLDLQGDQWDPLLSLNATLPSSLSLLSSLQILRLSQWKNIKGAIPASLSKLTNVVVLDLEGNNLSGAIPDSLCQLPKIQHILLGSNALSGSLPECLTQLSNLTRFTATGNNLNGHLPLTLGSLSSLKELALANNRLSGPIPDSVGKLRNLEKLQLAGNMLTGGIPESIGSLENLLVLSLNGNQLSGKIPASIGRLSRLQWLQVSGNQLSGEMPQAISELSRLITLDVSGNQLEGAIPKCLENLTRLASIDVSRNMLNSFEPCMKGADSPLYLDISHNKLRLGKIPAWIMESSKVYCLHMADCGITMDIEDFKPAAPGIYRSIDLSANDITGDATALFEQMPELRQLNLSNNRISYDLKKFSLQGLVSLDARNNLFHGPITNLVKSSTQGCGAGGCTKYVDLSGNRVSGRIPRLKSGQKNLQWLDLSRNALTGPIPPTISLFENLQHLDLSSNALKGSIPTELGRIKSLKYFNVSNNRLCKSIPPGLPFPASSYEQNKCLCGNPLQKPCGHRQ